MRTRQEIVRACWWGGLLGLVVTIVVLNTSCSAVPVQVPRPTACWDEYIDLPGGHAYDQVCRFRWCTSTLRLPTDQCNMSVGLPIGHTEGDLR